MSLVCSPEQLLYTQYIIAPLCLLAAISIFTLCCYYAVCYAKGNIKSPKILFILSVVFFVISCIFFVVYTIKEFVFCQNFALWSILNSIMIILDALQIMIYIGILFYRLYFIFNDTNLAVSTRTIRVFAAWYIFTWIPIFFLWISYTLYYIQRQWILGHSVTIVVAFTTFLCTVSLTILLVCLYINKLIATYRLVHYENSHRLIHVITKTSLLFFLSSLVYLIAVILLLLRLIFFYDSLNSVHYRHNSQIVNVLDDYLNFVTVFLSHQYFDNLYMKLCGSCDSACVSLWNHCITNKRKASDMIEMELEASGRDQTNITRDEEEADNDY